MEAGRRINRGGEKLRDGDLEEVIEDSQEVRELILCIFISNTFISNVLLIFTYRVCFLKCYLAINWIGHIPHNTILA